MKVKNKIYTLLLILVICTACDNQIEDLTKGQTIPAGEKQVEMTFQGSQLTQGQQVQNDKEVKKMDLVVCKEGKYQYTRQAYTSDYATFRATLKIDDNIDVYFFANSNTIEQNQHLLQEGTPWNEIHPQLLLRETTITIEGKTLLPMWGEIKAATVSDQNVNSFGKITLLRSVAAANVYFCLKSGMQFIPEKAYLYFAADRAYSMPQQDNLIYEQGILTEVKKAIAPQDMRTTTKLMAEPKEGNFTDMLYMFDNDTAEDFKTHPQNKRTRIVIGGYLPETGETSYYPLDFFQEGTKELLQATRNQQYNLYITAVNSKGYPDPDEAAESAAVNIDYQVITWKQNNDENIAIDGPNYLSLQNKYIPLTSNKGAVNRVNITTTYQREEISIEFTQEHNGTQEEIQEGIQNQRFKVELKENGSSLQLIVTARKDYTDTNQQANKDKLLLKAGRIKFEIQIEQIPSKGWNEGGDKEIIL